jgi:hypothetical protein
MTDRLSNLPNDFGKRGTDMGGMNSGTWYRWDARDTTESQKRIDIRYMKKNGFLRSGCSGSLTWTCGSEEAGNINFRVIDGFLKLSYLIRMYGSDWEPVEESVKIAWTPCNYGGHRPWFLCPIIGCGRRVAVLYGAGRYFACRHCYDLAYQSQREQPYERAMRKSHNIIKRMGGDPDDDFWPDKPRHMHWKTYNRLIDQAEYYSDLSWGALERYLKYLG